MPYIDRSVEISSLERTYLAAHQRTTKLRFIEMNPFRATPHGLHGRGLLMAIGEGPTAVLVENYPMPDPDHLTIPCLRLHKMSTYCGEWAGQLAQLAPLSARNHKEGLKPRNVQVVHDSLMWSDLSTGNQFSIETDIGLSFDLENGSSLLVLATDSIAGITDLVLTETSDQLMWWMSSAGIRYAWEMDDTDPDLQIHRARRTCTLP